MSKDIKALNRWDSAKIVARQIQRDTKNIVANVFELIEAASLITVAVYALWSAKYRYNFNGLFPTLLACAAVVILVLGGALLVKHLNKRGQ